VVVSFSGGPDTGLRVARTLTDVYNMQLSNEPAEELARILVDSGKGDFELCGFFAGGAGALRWLGMQLKSIFIQALRRWRAPSSLPVRSASGLGLLDVNSIFYSVLG
jgi:hypothetical protein